MPIVGISGPLATGKSTLVSLLESKLPEESFVIHDIHEYAYNDMMGKSDFNDFRIISKDRDFFLLYYGKVINYYIEMMNKYKDSNNIVLVDGTHLDLLIYGMLNLWYHYPSRGVQENFIHKLLDSRPLINVVYMTQADDLNYKLDRVGMRRYSTAFMQNRKTEILYYEIFSELPYVVKLPSASVLDCDEFIIQDMKARNLIGG